MKSKGTSIIRGSFFTLQTDEEELRINKSNQIILRIN
jgi:hypothetical protein